MRICLYTASALPKLGGQEAVVDALARQFLKLGHEPFVLAPPPRRPLRERDVELPYRVVRHPRFISTRQFVSWYGYFLRRAHARLGFDVIHCHDVYPTGYVAALCKRSCGVPVVITSHGGDVREHNPRLRKPGIPQRCVLALRGADALVSIGSFTERGFRRIDPDADHVVTIPNGVDLEAYRSPADRPHWLAPEIQPGNYLLFLGRLVKRKGVDVLLEALSMPPADVVARSLRLVIAGTGEARREWEEQAHRLGLLERVFFVGPVEGADKVYLLQNAFCTVMPSREWESFGLVVLESYAAGRPVIASGVIDLVQHGKTGLLVPQEDSVALSVAIAEIVRDPDARARMSAGARQVADSFSWPQVAQRHLQLYQELIHQGAGANRSIRC